MKKLLIIISGILAIVIFIGIVVYNNPEYLNLYGYNGDKIIILVKIANEPVEKPPRGAWKYEDLKEYDRYGTVANFSEQEMNNFPSFTKAIENIGQSKLNPLQGFTTISNQERQELKNLTMIKASGDTPELRKTTKSIFYDGNTYHYDIDLKTKVRDNPAVIFASVIDYENYPQWVDKSGHIDITYSDSKHVPKLLQAITEIKDIPIFKIEQLAYLQYLNNKFIDKYGIEDSLLSNNIIKFEDNFYHLQFGRDSEYIDNCPFWEPDCSPQ